ncbi:MAG: type I DNA topoisomerase [Armatimonadetes bacterium]|nr:type I DNA topoisomerase [Armatimonadota bacterium]
MSKALIIVESPAKTKTLKNFLEDEFNVEASMGHVRDLPEKELGVDIEHGFKPKYVIIPERKKVLAHLKKQAKRAGQVYLATDPDREGEAIAWHLIQVLGLKNAKRIAFNEITRNAVRDALAHPQEVNERLVDAQQARRVLDRLVGYKLSPLLWQKVKKYLSAGRVQSVAVRLICDREREIQAFVPEEYWSLTALLTKFDNEKQFSAKLVEKNGEKIKLKNESEAKQVLSDLEGAKYIVVSIKEREQKRHPSPPFITSTLQQDASRKLGFSSKKTMLIAQELYEGIELGPEGSVGLITYMRTDSTRVASEAIAQARNFIESEFGKEYLPADPRQYKSKKTAQDAHEAIRPTLVSRRPEDVKKYLTADQFRLYQLIWQRFLASQMESAVLKITTVDISAKDYLFRANGSTVKFPGFTILYIEGKDNGKDEEEDQILPRLAKDETLHLVKMIPKQHFTEPPPRYTEATLVKALEEKGIGRPSTYATIISTIQERKYVLLEDRKFVPTELGFVVNDLLVKHFPDIIDVEFTAGVESKLDEIEEGELNWVDVLNEFWNPFKSALENAEKNMEKVKIFPKETNEKCPNCGLPLFIWESKFGQLFLGCSGYPTCKTVVSKGIGEPCPVPGCGGTIVEASAGSGKYRCSNYPKCTYASHAENNTNGNGGEEVTDQNCPQCGKPLVKRTSKYGKFLGCSGYPKCKYIENIPQPVGVACPIEGCTGEIAEKQTRRGKTFYGCNRYPECTFVSWDKPIGRKCPKCGSMLVEKQWNGNPRGIECIAEECDYKESITEEPKEEVIASQV